MFPETKGICVQCRRGDGVWQIIDHQGEKYWAKDTALWGPIFQEFNH